MHFQIKRSRLLAASIFQHGQGPSVRPRQRERVRPPSALCRPPVFLLYSPSLSFSPPPLVRRLGPCDVGGLEGMSEGDRDRIRSQFTNGIFLRTTSVIGRNLVAAAAAGVGKGVSLLAGAGGHGGASREESKNDMRGFIFLRATLLWLGKP